ncbi:MAG: hypothetical protein GY757_30205 [bacterium]|nr:hypothetical protein [bacterium]
MNLPKITLVFFVEAIDNTNRKRYESLYKDSATGTTVIPLFIETGR